jgi:hypothetical protein
MSSEEKSFYGKEKERLIKEIAKVTEEISLTLNSINRSQEGTITLARDKATGETNMWMYLRDVGIAKAKEMAQEAHEQGAATGGTGKTDKLASSTGSRSSNDFTAQE